jgi:hypothetical protein
MALQSSGTISMGQINTELQRSATSTISLGSAEDGGYGAINTNSASRPSSSKPARMSEWYNYNHTASCDPYGTFLYSYCSGCTLYEFFANGYCGSFGQASSDSPACGCGSCPPYGQLAFVMCSGCITTFSYHDGNCGYYQDPPFVDCTYC